MKIFDEKTMEPKWYVILGAVSLQLLIFAAMVFIIVWAVRWGLS